MVSWKRPLWTTVEKVHMKFKSNRTIVSCWNHETKFCLRRKKFTAQNDDFWILIRPDPKGISKFCKRQYILLDAVYNYKTKLINKTVRNEVKSDRKNDTQTFSTLRYIVQLGWHISFWFWGYKFNPPPTC